MIYAILIQIGSFYERPPESAAIMVFGYVVYHEGFAQAFEDGAAADC